MLNETKHIMIIIAKTTKTTFIRCQLTRLSCSNSMIYVLVHKITVNNNVAQNHY